MATNEATFRYFGKVVDGDNHPIAGAKVTFGMSSQSTVHTWSDDHQFLYATTQADGHYEIKLGTPWVRGMDAEADGFKRTDRWDVSDVPSYAPGEYNFTLKKK
jgi:hypothetical protein